jgi:ABC-type multidrug transport system ATPase subunit
MRVLEAVELTKRFRNGTLANDRITLSVQQGEIYALLGPNGAGKTTLVRQLLGLLKPTSGSLRVNGVDVIADPGFARRVIGFLPQAQFALETIHVDELIFGVAKLRGLSSGAARARTEELIERLDLGPFRQTPLSAASGGVRRLTGLATAIAGNQDVLVLDEPTNDVDPARRQLLWGIIDELGRQGTTVLLVTHNLAEAERVIDRFAIIDHGRILQEGTPAALRTLVTERLRLELTAVDGVEPHEALQPDPSTAGAFLFEPTALAAIATWIEALHEAGRVVDFRIGPPTLDDIYSVAINRGNSAVALAEAS